MGTKRNKALAGILQQRIGFDHNECKSRGSAQSTKMFKNLYQLYFRAQDFPLQILFSLLVSLAKMFCL